MKILFYRLFFISLIALPLTLKSQEIKTRISGEIIGRSTTGLYLVPIRIDDNERAGNYEGELIPIIDNKFEYTLINTCVEEYYLIFKEEMSSGFYRREFFNDSSNLRIIIYPDSIAYKNNFYGGTLNRTKHLKQQETFYNWHIISQRINSLIKNGDYYTEKYVQLQNKFKSATKDSLRALLKVKLDSLGKTEASLTPNAKKAGNDYKKISDSQENWDHNYIIKYSDELALSLFFKSLRKLKDINEPTIEVYHKFSKHYPNHPYTLLAGEMLKTIQTLKIGGSYIDFQALSADGNLVRLSDSIQGKVAIIDLWGTWCGPCIKQSLSFKPIYVKYKDKRFTVFGVAGVFKNMDDYYQALEKHKFPWVNLVELNNQNNIWFKYGISGLGGAKFLVDTKGKILAIDPTIDELEKILYEIYN